jgi:hypothetical protein
MVAVCAALALRTPLAWAQDDAWQGAIVPYAGLYAVTGENQFDEYRIPVDSRSGDLESVLGATLAAWKGRWGGSVEAWWTSSSGVNEIINASGITVVGERESNLLQSEAMAMFHVLGPPTKPLRLLAGARYNYMKASVRLSSSYTQFGQIDSTGTHTENWVDPFLGVLWMGNTDGTLWGAIRGDVGGFGVGADVVWQIRATAALHVGEKADLTVGVRYMNIDYDSGEADSDRFAHNAEHTAFLFGVVIRTP